MDGPLTRLLNDKMLNVGQKLCIYGAELVGSEQAVSPLEVKSYISVNLQMLFCQAVIRSVAQSDSYVFQNLFFCFVDKLIRSFVRPSFRNLLTL